MNYASLDEIYNDNNKMQQQINEQQQRQNSYDNIIKDLIYSQKEDSYSNIPEPISTSNNFTTYQKVQNTSNKISPKKSAAKLEKRIENFEDSYKSKKIAIDIDNIPCDNMLEHILKCDKCRNIIIEEFQLNNKTIEDKKREDMLDVAIYVLTGVFVLFLLDSFMNLGKYLKK